MDYRKQTIHQRNCIQGSELWLSSPWQVNNQEGGGPGSVPWSTPACSFAVKDTMLGREEVKMWGGTELLKASAVRKSHGVADTGQYRAQNQNKTRQNTQITYEVLSRTRVCHTCYPSPTHALSEHLWSTKIKMLSE